MIALGRRVQRKVASLKGKVLVVSLAPEGIWLREYRKRTGFVLPYDLAMLRAVALATDATRVVTPRRPKRRAR